MPRIYTSQSDPLDFCINHFPKTEQLAFERYGVLGNAPDDRGNAFSYDDDHPDYGDDDMYACEVCGKRLDNGVDGYWDGSFEKAAWESRFKPFAYHHIDGDINNNSMDNLRVIRIRNTNEY